MSPLRGADGEVYAIAQGNLVVGGLGVSGADGSTLAINIPSVGRVPLGASVERSVPSPFANTDHIIFNLSEPDFTSARRVVDAINEAFGSPVAEAMDAVSVSVIAPKGVSERVSFVGYLQELEVTPGEGAAKVIVNSRTGTIVIGSHVTVGPAAVTHGSLVVRISENPGVVQPQPFANGETAIVEDTEIDVEQQGDGRMFELGRGTTLSDIVQAINEQARDASASDSTTVISNAEQNDEALEAARAFEQILVRNLLKSMRTAARGTESGDAASNARGMYEERRVWLNSPQDLRLSE